MITIFGTKDYYHVRSVSEELAKKNVFFTVIDFNSKSKIQFDIDQKANFHFLYNGKSIADSNVIWQSEKYISYKFGDSQEWVNDYTISLMWRNSLQNISNVLDCPVVNSQDAINNCAHKLLQLKVASRNGFLIPDSIVSNHTGVISRHLGQHGRIITKMIGDSHLPIIDDGVKQEAIPTCRVDVDYLEKNPNCIEPFPIFVQAEIEKKTEYRCIFVYDDIFTLSIDPKQHKIMEVDYRKGGYMIEYTPTQLPKEIEGKLFSLMHELGLFSACIDLIEDIHGEFVFLEVNPEGVWGLHDEILDCAISKKLANSLIRISEGAPVLGV